MLSQISFDSLPAAPKPPSPFFYASPLLSPKTRMFFSDPRHCDIELLMPYFAAMSSMSSCGGGLGGGPIASSVASQHYAARARCRAQQQPAPAPQQQPSKQRENPREVSAPSSPRPAAPTRPAFEKKVEELAESSVGLQVRHFPPSSRAPQYHIFSIDLPGRSLSSFDISVEEREGAGRLCIDAAAIRSIRDDETEKGPMTARNGLALSLDLPRDADLSRVSADYEAGVLLIKVPVVQKEEAPKRFKVVVGGGAGGEGKEEKEKEEEKKVEKSSPAPPSPPPSASLGAVAAADLSGVSVTEKKDESDDDDEDGSWKAVSSDDEEEEEEEGEVEDEEEGTKVSRPSSPSSSKKNKNNNKNKKAPSGGAVLEAIEDDDKDAGA